MAFLAGLGAAAFAVSGWRVPTQSTPAASLQVVAVGTSELVASPANPFLIARNLRPGSSSQGAGGQAMLLNTMAQPLAVRVRALPSVPDLNRVVRVRVTGGGTPVFRGTLGDLRSWSRREFVVASQRRAALQLQAWVPASVKRGYQNRDAEVTLEFDLAPADQPQRAATRGRG